MSDSQLVQETVTISNIKGLHARASAAFVKKAEEFACEISVQRAHETVEGTSILGLLMLAASKGTEIIIICDGDDAPEALKALVELVTMGFYEDEG